MLLDNPPEKISRLPWDYELNKLNTAVGVIYAQFTALSQTICHFEGCVVAVAQEEEQDIQ